MDFPKESGTRHAPTNPSSQKEREREGGRERERNRVGVCTVLDVDSIG